MWYEGNEDAIRSHIEDFIKHFRYIQGVTPCRDPDFNKEPTVNVIKDTEGYIFQYNDYRKDDIVIVYDEIDEHFIFSYKCQEIPGKKNTRRYAEFFGKSQCLYKISYSKLKRVDKLIDKGFYPEAIIILVSALENFIRDYHMILHQRWFSHLRYMNIGTDHKINEQKLIRIIYNSLLHTCEIL